MPPAVWVVPPVPEQRLESETVVELQLAVALQLLPELGLELVLELEPVVVVVAEAPR